MAENDDDCEIICCGTRGWVKTIAWFQIIFNFLGSLASFIGMVLERRWYRGFGLFLLSLVGFDFCIIGIYFGIVLLRGAIHVNVDALKRWLRYEVICWIFCLHILIIGTMLFSWLFLIMILPLLLSLWGMGMVCSFKDEAEKNANEGSGGRTTTAPVLPKQMPTAHYSKNQQSVSLNTAFREPV